MVRQSLGQRLSSLRVGQKIGLGYTLALGIAVCGTIAGFGVGDHYQQETQEHEQHARNEVELLQRLQSRVLQARTHQQQLIPLAQYPEKFQDEYAHLLKHKAEIQKIWAELKAFVAKYHSRQDNVHHATILAFLQTYDRVPQLYSQELERRVERIRSLDLASPTDVEQAQALMLEFTNSDLALEYDGISDDLVGFIDHAYQELEVATRSYQQASEVAEKLVVASIGLSVAIAILLAILTSRAIAQPIQALTSVARRTTEESNFELQATVEQDDEIGMLANAFNQLIRAVQQLLQQQKTANEQLENYSQTLESEVEVRTQELSDKNTQLQQLLEELQRTQVQMVQSEKMSALGQMVAGVAHEINNPANFIHGNLTHVQEYAHNLLGLVQLYQNYYPDPAPEIQAEAEDIDMEFIQADLPKVLDSMKLGTDRIRQIVLSLRNFSRMDEADFKAVDIHEGIDSTLLILQHRLKDKPERPAIQVIRDYGNLPLIECYPGQINQAFMNILANAIDALEEANVKRTYQEIKENPNLITIRTAMIDSKWVKIAISDNGTGMSESVQKRLFDPFFTTKSVGKGTGLGLAISYQIVTEKHGGKLDCCSIPGEGTEFVIQILVQQQIRDAV
ncbi:HAMP domain-containing protein [Microcoleus vaginatus PCC 9802]|uniref:sensor histidine kinase n=1 Tax=Microcoleus vaginatus TaxID=119532 RepID=UPI00020D2481|nr:integral membrane sensor signal transduction histidine kinase [Microcoleus vaginatus FGP-2]UNU20721.1 HAMP domain-containing protein [Microcoleus vaginatus PCC 9802]